MSRQTEHPRVWLVRDERGERILDHYPTSQDIEIDAEITECVAMPVDEFERVQADAARLVLTDAQCDALIEVTRNRGMWALGSREYKRDMLRAAIDAERAP